MDLRIIGLSGRMGSGKDEVYKTATKLVGSEPIQRIAFGDMVKQEVADLLGLSIKYIETRKSFSGHCSSGGEQNIGGPYMGGSIG